jgi:hypothetical protein
LKQYRIERGRIAEGKLRHAGIRHLRLVEEGQKLRHELWGWQTWVHAGHISPRATETGRKGQVAAAFGCSTRFAGLAARRWVVALYG